jgi:putative component of toxin-antitoxin plasmid stabilization module
MGYNIRMLVRMILLAGGDKSTQQKDIEIAVALVRNL